MLKLSKTVRQIVVALALFTFGFMITITIKKSNEPQVLSNARENELVQVLTELNRQNEQLSIEINDQEDVLNSLQSGSTQNANQAALDRANALGVLAGTKTVLGPGITMVLKGDSASINAFTLIDAVQELRDAGSVAIQINNVRVVANTWFIDTVGGVSISGSVKNTPINIKVIGEPQTLETAMRIPGGFEQGVIANGGEIEIKRSNIVEIDAILTPEPPKIAQPTN
ncbi:MAG: DUF881 domain-containing protein [Candidatus Nanopelagicales bacterium]